MKSLALLSTRAVCSAASGGLDARNCDTMDDSHMIDSSRHTSLSSQGLERGSKPSLDDFKQDTFSTFINTRFRNADVGAFSVYTFLHIGYLRLYGWTRRHFRRFFFHFLFPRTDYFQVYLFVEFLGGTIRFEFLDKRDFWTTPAVERYQEQFVGQRRAIIAEYQLDVGLAPFGGYVIHGVVGREENCSGAALRRERCEEEDERSVSDRPPMAPVVGQAKDRWMGSMCSSCFFTTGSSPARADRQEAWNGTEQSRARRCGSGMDRCLDRESTSNDGC